MVNIDDWRQAGIEQGNEIELNNATAAMRLKGPKAFFLWKEANPHFSNVGDLAVLMFVAMHHAR